MQIVSIQYILAYFLDGTPPPGAIGSSLTYQANALVNADPFWQPLGPVTIGLDEKGKQIFIQCFVIYSDQ